MKPEERIAEQLQSIRAVEVAWLYGSRASGLASEDSDFDIAVALAANTPDRARLVDDIAYSLTQLQGIDVPVSVVDVNRIPTPLARNVIEEGVVIVCRSDFRLHTEQQRIWSLWEEYEYLHERNRERL